MKTFTDLREFIDRVREMDDCRVIEDADWDLEIGQICEWQANVPDSPLLLFDKIKGYPKGYRVASNLFNKPNRTALALGLSPDSNWLDQIKAWRKKEKGIKPVPPREVKDGPVLQNIDEGEDVNLYKFPAPKWHQLDGGRFIGTGDMVITKDPDEGWVNIGTYRVQIQNKNSGTIFMSPGRHGDMIRNKYWARGQNCPVAVICGQAPHLWAASIFPLPARLSEYEYAGGLGGSPVETIKAPFSGLPVPANAEIVLDGEMLPYGTEDYEEGPFGEWPGYYSSADRPEPAFKVRAILHRNEPILQGNPPLRMPLDYALGRHIRKAAALWDVLDSQVTGVKGVGIMENAGIQTGVIISLKQEYSGHAMQAAMTAIGARSAAYLLRYVIVVDDDIDPTDTREVMWALGTRCDPETSIQIVKGLWGSLVDPILPPEKRERRQMDHSAAVILACKPYHWMKDFPLSIKTDPELMQKTKKKWAKLFP